MNYVSEEIVKIMCTKFLPRAKNLLKLKIP
jgi:hypothetical protein